MTDTDTTDVAADGITGDFDIDDTNEGGLAVPEQDGTLDVFRAPALNARPLSQARVMLADHVAMMRDAFALADGVCYTAAVPERYRGKPKDGAAAILYGAPLGMDPMTSLQKVINVHGTPGLEARSMKGLLKSKGYTFRTVERSPTRFEIHAWEPGSDKRIDPPDEVSVWTIERAQQAEFCPTIDPATGEYRTFNKKSGGTAVVGNMKYITQPTEMLEAKGTAEVCRAVAPDVLMGMPYTVEELETQRWDNDDEPDTASSRQAAPAPARAKGTAGLRDRARARKKRAEPAQEPMDAEVVDEPATGAPTADDAPEPTQTVPDPGSRVDSPAPSADDDTPPTSPAQEAEAATQPDPVMVDFPAQPDDPAPADAAKAGPGHGVGNDQGQGAETSSGSTSRPAPGDQVRPADDMQMSPEVRSKGVDMLVGLLINGGVEDEYRADALSEIAAKRPDATYRRIETVDALTNTELKFLVDTLRAWKQKDQLKAWLGEAVNNAALRAAGMLDGAE